MPIHWCARVNTYNHPYNKFVNYIFCILNDNILRIIRIAKQSLLVFRLKLVYSNESIFASDLL